MRIIDPKQSDRHSERKPRMRVRRVVSVLVIPVLISGLVAVAYSIWDDRSADQNVQSDSAINNQDRNTDTATVEVVETIKDNQVPKTLRIFTDNEFKVFFDQLLQPNLERVANPPEISGNVVADARIRSIAQERGYKLRSSPSVELVTVDGYSLQSAVAEPWADLKAAAAAEGHSISIVSGYRSVERQRDLYLSRLSAAGATITEVEAGTADEQVNEVLITSSIPGYSKHHTGYTIDILCAGYAFENFKSSPCNDWITADNYKVAKEHGFIPSYPPLADAQGPDPEAWEYVYVGTDLLYE